MRPSGMRSAKVRPTASPGRLQRHDLNTKSPVVLAWTYQLHDLSAQPALHHSESLAHFEWVREHPRARSQSKEADVSFMPNRLIPTYHVIRYILF